MEEIKPKKVIVILSGGLDSTTLLYDLHSRKDEFEIVSVLSFDYGQRHKKELVYASDTCIKLGLDHHEVNLEHLNFFLGGSSLTDNIDVPEGHYEEENMKLTVVPNRNMIMLSIAVGYAVSKGAELVAYGAHAGDHMIYPDCRPEFIQKMNEVCKIANFQSVEILAPYINVTKIEILQRGVMVGVPYKETWTCYKGLEKACGKCGSCQERLTAFKENGLEDPLEYESRELIKKIS